MILFVFSAVKKFLLNKLSLGDVWMVGIRQAIEWIKTPTSLDDIENFAPWKCDSPPPPPSCNSPNVCSFRDNPNYLWTCTRPCPPHYPWVKPRWKLSIHRLQSQSLLFLSCRFVSKTKAIKGNRENLQNEISPWLCFVLQLNSENELIGITNNLAITRKLIWTIAALTQICDRSTFHQSLLLCYYGKDRRVKNPALSLLYFLSKHVPYF